MIAEMEIRQSNLKWMAKSPAHYRYNLEHGCATSRAMLIGTAVHRMVLGGPPVQVFDGTRRGSKWDEFKAQHPGEAILNETEYDEARAIAKSVCEHAGDVLDGCSLETTLKWSFMGRRCSSTPDAYDARRIIELKVSRTADPRYFWQHMSQQHWDAQLAFYERAVAAGTEVDGYKVPPKQLIIIAVEPQPPFACTVFELPQAARVTGAKKIISWMELLLSCERNNHWPAYSERPVKLAAPDWVADGMDDEEEPEEEVA